MTDRVDVLLFWLSDRVDITTPAVIFNCTYLLTDKSTEPDIDFVSTYFSILYELPMLRINTLGYP